MTIPENIEKLQVVGFFNEPTITMKVTVASCVIHATPSKYIVCGIVDVRATVARTSPTTCFMQATALVNRKDDLYGCELCKDEVYAGARIGQLPRTSESVVPTIRAATNIEGTTLD